MADKPTMEEIIADIRRVQAENPDKEVSRRFYHAMGKYPEAVWVDWGKLKAAADVRPNKADTMRQAIENLPEPAKEEPVSPLDRDLIHHLKKQIKALEKQLLYEGAITNQVLQISRAALEPPVWLLNLNKTDKTPGVPTVLCSDWHYGEVTNTDAILGYNEFGIDIANQRLKLLAEIVIDLCFSHMVTPYYPGIVVPLAGDMISGDIHDELLKTNEMPTIPALVELYKQLIEFIEQLKRVFGNVFLPCVTGNHGRTTKKMQAKQRVETSYDYLLYVLLQKWFENDPGVRFLIPRSQDCMYKIYDHVYLERHGDCFRGGDGLIGHLGPVQRGDFKTRSRNSIMGHPYNTMIVGHFHQLKIMDDIITNGSLCGYNEFGFNNNFKPEPPQQAMWFTHPKLGITFRMPIFLHRDTQKVDTGANWVSVLTE
jgi:hypothetical protein